MKYKRRKVNKIKNNVNKSKILQFSLTGLTFIVTIFLPIIGYSQFITFNNEGLEAFQAKYNLVFIETIIVGAVLTGIRFYIYQLSQYSIKRGFLNLLNSICFIIFLTITAQIGDVDIAIEGFSLNLNLSGVFLIIIAVWSLFIIKNMVDLYDFKKNRIYYENLLRNKKRKLK